MSLQKLTDGLVLVDTSTVTPSTPTTLAAAVTTLSQTAFTVTSGALILNNTYITILLETTNTTETVLVTAGGGTVNLTVTRAQLGTAASLHSNGATVNIGGALIFTLLTIAQCPNIKLIVRKSSADINYVKITAGGANTFPGGGTTLLLIDNAGNGTAQIKFPGSGNVLIPLVSGAGQVGPAGPSGASAVAPGDVTITSFTVSQVHTPDGGFGPQFALAVTPPGPIGTFIGCHLYLEYPDQSAGTSFAVGTGALGTDGLQGTWAPLDLGQFPYIAAQQPFTFPVPANVDLSSNVQARVYAAAYSTAIDNTLVRAGGGGATPNATFTVVAPTRTKPSSAVDVTHLLVTGVSAVVLAAVTVSGKLKRPISVTVDFTGLPAVMPTNWAYQLLGFANGDITTDPVLASGYFNFAGVIGSGPDGITVDHTFGPDEPTAIMPVTIFAVAGLLDLKTTVFKNKRGATATPGTFTANNIVKGITASCAITIGTLTGVTDPTKFIAANLSPVFGNVATLFDVVPLAIDNTRQGLLAISTVNLQALAVTNPILAALAVDAAKLATAAVTATKIGALAVGTAAIQNGAITNALIANLAVGTANIQALAVTDAQIGSLSVAKLTAGTISVAVSITAPTITATSGTTTLLISPTAVGGVAGMKITNTAATYANDFLSVGMRVTNTSGATVVYSDSVTMSALGGALTSQFDVSGVVVNGVRVVTAQTGTRPVTLADVISTGVAKGWWV